MRALVWLGCAVALVDGLLEAGRYANRGAEALLWIRCGVAGLGLLALPLRGGRPRAPAAVVLASVLLALVLPSPVALEGGFLQRAAFETALLAGLVLLLLLRLPLRTAPVAAGVATLILLEVGLSVWAARSRSPLFADVGLRLPAAGSAFGYAFNSSGYPDDEFFRAGPRDLVVALVADSFGVGVVPRPDHFASLAEARLREAFPGYARVAIHDFGVAAIGMPEYRHLIETEVPETDPALVVVCVFVGNDLAGSPRRSRLSLRGWWLWIVPQRLLTLRRVRPAMVHTPTRPPWLDDPALEPPTFPEEEFLRIERERLAVLEGEADDFFAGLDAIHARLGSRLAVMLIPDEFQVNDALWQRLPGAGLDRDRPQRRILARCRERGIPALDLLPVLRAAERDGHTYHLRDTHWNARGNRVAGEALAAFLIDLLEEKPPPGNADPGGGPNATLENA